MGGRSPARGRAQRKALASRERELAALARGQHGVVSRSQLIAGGLSMRTIDRRVEAGRLCVLHRGVYAFGPGPVGRRGEWMAAVLACGDGALLSHRSAAAIWGLAKGPRGAVVEVTATVGRGRPGIIVHEGGVYRDDRSSVNGIPVTSVARTLFDLAELIDERKLERAFEEADRLNLLEMRALDQVCSRGFGRRALRPVRRLIEEARAPVWTRSDLEDRFAVFCREQGFPPGETNAEVLGHEVDVLWPVERLIVELDSYTFHRHRAAFEADRTKDVARQAAGYRAIRVTDRRLKQEPAQLAREIYQLLSAGSRDRRAGS